MMVLTGNALLVVTKHLNLDAIDQGQALPTPEQVRRSLELQERAWEVCKNGGHWTYIWSVDQTEYNTWVRDNFARYTRTAYNSSFHYKQGKHTLDFVVGPNPVEGWENMIMKSNRIIHRV